MVNIHPPSLQTLESNHKAPLFESENNRSKYGSTKQMQFANFENFAQDQPPIISLIAC
jgi:hypothetical protein